MSLHPEPKLRAPVPLPRFVEPARQFGTESLPRAKISQVAFSGGWRWHSTHHHAEDGVLGLA
jgi:hypothetical protein